MRTSRLIYLAWTLALVIPSLADAQEEGSSPAETDLPPESLEQLVERLGSNDPNQRIEALRGLEAHGEASTPHLVRTLGSDPVPEVRGWAARILGQIESEEGRTALSEALRSDPDERVRALIGRLIGEDQGDGASSPFAAPGSQPGPAVQPDGSMPPPYAQPSYQPQPYQTGYGGPFGYNRTLDTNRALRVLGWLGFGAIYGASLIVGAVMVTELENGWWWFVPLAGPAVWGTALADDNRDDPAYPVTVFFAILCWADSLVQAAGLAMAITGHVRGRDRQVEQQTQEPAESAGSPRLSLSFAGPTGPGLTLSGVF